MKCPQPGCEDEKDRLVRGALFLMVVCFFCGGTLAGGCAFKYRRDADDGVTLERCP